MHPVVVQGGGEAEEEFDGFGGLQAGNDGDREGKHRGRRAISHALRMKRRSIRSVPGSCTPISAVPAADRTVNQGYAPAIAQGRQIAPGREVVEAVNRHIDLQ